MPDRPTFVLADFPGRLASWQDYLRWPLQTLAKAADVHRTGLWKWRNRKVSATVDAAHRVIAAMAVPFPEFFDETPDERVRRLLADAARAPAPSLASVATVAPRDLLAAMNQVPLAAAPEPSAPGGLVAQLEGDGLQSLVTLPLIDAARYPSQASTEERRSSVVHALSELELYARQWGFPEEDQRLLEQAWRTLDVKP